MGQGECCVMLLICGTNWRYYQTIRCRHDGNVLNVHEWDGVWHTRDMSLVVSVAKCYRLLPAMMIFLHNMYRVPYYSFIFTIYFITILCPAINDTNMIDDSFSKCTEVYVVATDCFIHVRIQMFRSLSGHHNNISTVGCWEERGDIWPHLLCIIHTLYEGVNRFFKVAMCLIFCHNFIDSVVISVFFIQSGCVVTHWGQVTHIWVGNLTITGSDNGLSPGGRQAIILTNAWILLIEPIGKNFGEVLFEICIFSVKKMRS